MPDGRAGKDPRWTGALASTELIICLKDNCLTAQIDVDAKRLRCS
jgi:hypothetical protein